MSGTGLVRLAVDVAALDARATNDGGVAIGRVVATIGAVAIAGGGHAFLRAAAKRTQGDNDRLVEQARRVEVGKESREALIVFAEAHQIPIAKDKRGEAPFSVDANLLHSSSEGKVLEDPAVDAPEFVHMRTIAPEDAPDKPLEVEIDYEQGNPVAVDGKKMSPAKLLAHLNKLGGAHGIGRVDLVENRYVGMKSRGVYETPGGTILHVAHRGLESLTMDREVLHFRDSLIPRFADLIYNGYWFSPEREMIQTAIDEAQKDVTGTARVKLYKGSCTLAGRKSKNSLYRLDIATFEEDEVYNQKDAEGFIRLNGLRLKIRAQRRKASA